MSGLLGLLIWVLVVGLVVGIVVYIADALPVPPPFNRIIKILAMVIGVIFVIMLLLQLVDGGVAVPKLE